MKKYFLIVSVVLFVLSGSVFAAGNDNRDNGLAFTTAEFDKSITTFDIDKSKLNTLKDEFLNNILTEGDSVKFGKLLGDVKDNENFIDYLGSKLDNIYDALADFVLNNPDIRQAFDEEEFWDDNGNIDKKKVKEFFMTYVTPEDIMDCLVLAIVDADISDVTLDSDFEELIDKVYAEVEKILNKENLDDLLNVIYEEVVKNINEDKIENLYDIIYKEVNDIVDSNNLESLFDEVYNKVIESITNDDILG